MAAGDSRCHLLLDPEYWVPRLRQLQEEPSRLILVPRDDLHRPGTEVVELRVRTHDGTQLRALMARSTFYKTDQAVQIRVCDHFETCAIDWIAVEKGLCDVVFPPLPNRRLEDRVLDVLRLATTLSSVETIDGATVTLWSGRTAPPDEFVIADLVRKRGWV